MRLELDWVGAANTDVYCVALTQGLFNCRFSVNSIEEVTIGDPSYRGVSGFGAPAYKITKRLH